ncbi:MAG: hypothetical protein JNL39_03960 [Opitutaceae bacterium]|nr:hypothetical protein [Opitutaceae bacterium]
MRSVRPLIVTGSVILTSLLVAPAAGAESAAKPVPPRSGAAAAKAGRVLPDPALLDGSNLPAIKKSEHGMIGDFELPGDDNARSGKVGGQQNGAPTPPGGGQLSGPQQMGLPSGGGAGGGQPPLGGAQAGGQQPVGGQQQAGAPPAAAGSPVAGGGEPGAQAQGIQVAELGGEAGGPQQAGASGGAEGGKPQQVSIGDKAMRIENASAAQKGVVGAQQQQAPNTQNHDKGTGTGGKGPSSTGGANRVEKGRAIPSGL